MNSMKRIIFFLFVAVIFASCKNAGFKTTPGGVQYRIFDSGSKDSTKAGYVLKMNQTIRVSGSGDSLLHSTYGGMPFFTQVQPGTPAVYAPDAVYPLLKKGDSAVVILSVDSLLKRGQLQEAQLPPFVKKSDQLVYTFKVLDVIKDEQAARLAFQNELGEEGSRQIAKQESDSATLEKSGEKQRQIAAVESYLKKKNIAASKTSAGVFVKIDNPGNGAQVAAGKEVTVKYTGKTLNGDRPFDSNVITAEISTDGGDIPGLEEGLKQFKQGGKGVIYIPGFLAYTRDVPSDAPFKAFDPLYFEVEIQKVADAAKSSR
ncbi:MAG: FKBP-type peptidyl-prolyl cis-trans isomerase [Niabella sp.]|nr:FKBP-type peptidyl-prolyl cis-trans isomerase [Niabella sp.]